MGFRLWGVVCLLVLASPAWAECRVLIVGDSLSSGYGLAAGTGWVDRLDARLKARAPGWRAINASISGDTTQNGRQRLKPALDRHRPQGVLIQLGGNDGLRGTPPAVVRENLAAMVREAQAAGAWVLLFDFPVLPNYGRAYSEAMAAVTAGLARESGVTRVPCFVCEVGVKPGMMQADGIHPNERAQPAMLDAVWPHLQPRLGACRTARAK